MPMTSEPGHTKFNLTYPPLPFNISINASTTNISSPTSSSSSSSTIPGILFGILVPHIICTIVIASRTSSRLFLLRKWFLDDTLILLAWIFSTSVCIVYSIASQSPQPSSSSSITTIHPYILRTYIGLIAYQLCLLLTKLSILAFYFRMFSSRPLERRLAWATVIFVILYGVPLLFMSVFQCHPVAGGFFGTPMKCFTFVPLLITSASLHTSTDAWLIVLIIPCIVRLDLPPRQKAALAVVLSLSIFVIAASLTRLQLSLKENYRPGGEEGLEEGDGVAVSNTLAFFVMTVLELDLALICASAPTLRPVVAKFWPRLGMGEMAVVTRRRRSSRWIPGVGRRGSGDDESSRGSVDLTSVVSYHGYPWTTPATPVRSKNASVNNLQSWRGYDGEGDVPAMPMPPLARVSTYRTPTTLSLRSFISSIAPRSRGQTGAGDRAGLLHQHDGDDPEVLERRRSSVGFEGYFDQYLGYGEVMEGGKRRSRNLIRVDTATTPARNSGAGRWANSQESFVLGVNDPNSPASPTVNRLSPVLSDSGTVVNPGSPTASRLSPVLSDADTVVAVGGRGEEEKISGPGLDVAGKGETPEPRESVAVDNTSMEK